MPTSSQPPTDPSPTFGALGLCAELQGTVDRLGWPQPTAIQARALPEVLAGRDVIGVAQTGSGKTAAFLLPVLQLLRGGPAGPAPRALVVAPTRELASQLHQEAVLLSADLPLRTAVVFGGVSEVPQVETLVAGVDVLIATPGRLLDLHRRGLVDLRQVGLWVLDEVDRLLDLGFLEDLQHIEQQLGPHQTLLFTATLSDATEQRTRPFVRGPIQVAAGPQGPPATLTQWVCYVRQADKVRLLVDRVGRLEGERVLVFVRTRAAADRAVDRLGAAGIAAVSLHGDKTQAQRTASLERFASGEVVVLVATDVAARGLHIEAVTHVVNVDLPTEVEAYVHRIGRAGRSGRDGVAISFCDPKEHGTLHAIQALTGRPLQPDLSHPFHDHDLIPGPAGKAGQQRSGRRRRRR